MSITTADLTALSQRYGVPLPQLKAVIDVEAAGKGFDPETGKILIQFEPLWFKRQFEHWKEFVSGHKWALNGVGVQSVEWAAFNDAFSIDSTAAMESTSIGMMQVMGFHWAKLGFQSVGDMWDFAKVSEANQVEIGLRFITARGNEGMFRALVKPDFRGFAQLYNGPQYEKFNYHNRMFNAYIKNGGK